MKRVRLRSKRAKMIAAAVAAVILAAGLFFRSDIKALVVPGSVPDVANCKADAKQFKCYEAYYLAYTKKTSSVEALKDLRVRADTDGYAKAQCHQLAHVIGHAALDKYGTLELAYTKGDNYCWSGYYHGVTEAAIGKIGAEGIRAQANTVCKALADKARYSFDHYNCVHGLGHGMMTVDNFNLFAALKSCDLITDSWEKESCYGGTFMENVMVAVRGDGTSKYLRPGELMYPCTAVDRTYKTQCYLMQTSYALKQDGSDFAKVAELCKTLSDKDFTPICYQSLGRDASGNTSSDIKLTKEKCEQTTEDLGLDNCITGAVRDIISFLHDDKQAKQFCDQFEGLHKSSCLDVATSYYKSF